MIILNTPRLVLRDHYWSDLESHHRLLSNEKVMFYLPDIQTSSLEESKVNLRESIEEINHPHRTKYFFRIENKTGNHIGEAGYTVTEFTATGKIVNLGYFIHHEYWSKGYVTEAVKEVIHFAFLENDVLKIDTGCLMENVGSEKVMQKCGFVKNNNNNQMQEHDSKLKPRVSYELTKDEWLNSTGGSDGK